MNSPRKVHRTTIPVRYWETDQMGVVHHAVFIQYFEVGRTEMMAEHGLDYAQMEREGHLLAVAEVGVRYRAPARFGDQLVVLTRVTHVGRARVRFDYRILRGEDENLLCEGHTVLASVAPDLTPKRLPAERRERLLAVLDSPAAET